MSRAGASPPKPGPGRGRKPRAGTVHLVRFPRQSPVVAEELNRRITGDPQRTPIDHVSKHVLGRQVKHALVTGRTEVNVAQQLIGDGIAKTITCLDRSARRVARVAVNLPPEFEDRVELVLGDFDALPERRTYGLVLARDLPRGKAADEWAEAVASRVAPRGCLCFDAAVGESADGRRDKAAELAQRLAARLPEYLRPERAGPAREDRAMSRDSFDRAVAALDARLERVELREYGGGLFHRLFDGVMGRYAAHDALVRVVMEADAILTDEGVIDTAHVWAVYRRSRPARRA